MASPTATGMTRTGGFIRKGGPLASLRHRDFRFLIVSTMLLQVGSWVQTIGQGWLVRHDLNGSATALATVALLRGGSLLLVSPVGGWVAGHFERRKQLMLYTGASAALAAFLAFLVATHVITLWMVYVLAAAAGVVEALAGPIRNLLVFDTVEAEDLTNAVAINALGGNVMRVIGPAIGGVLIATVGTQGTFMLQAICLAFAVGVTWFLHESHPDDSGRMGMLQSIGGGLAYTFRERKMLIIVGMAILPSVLVYPYVTFLPVFSTEVLHKGAGTYGAMAASVGLGSLLGGAVVAATSSRGGKGKAMMWACFIYCLFVAIFSQMTTPFLALLALTGAGVFHSVYAALNASLMQLEAAPEYRSRVVSLQTMTWGMTPFAALLMGRMIDHWSFPPIVLIWMLVAAGITLLLTFTSREIRRI